MNKTLPISLLLLVCALGCKDVNRGQSAAHEHPVADGRIVLLKRGSEIGAFVLQKQSITPERTDFTWYYRADGKGTFSTGDVMVSTGFVAGATNRIRFKSFSVGWSGNEPRMGWVYYSALPTDFEMCVTSETNIAMIDAIDQRWTYRARPSVNKQALVDNPLVK